MNARWREKTVRMKSEGEHQREEIARMKTEKVHWKETTLKVKAEMAHRLRRRRRRMVGATAVMLTLADHQKDHRDRLQGLQRSRDHHLLHHQSHYHRALQHS